MSVLVGHKAPDFTVPAVLANGDIVEHFNLIETIRNKYGLVFFYPLDFTFVCPSELIALDKASKDFQQRDVKVIAVSIDSQFAHNAWRNTPIEKGGIGPIRYPLVSDVNHSICRNYGIEHFTGVALRGVFLIDKRGLVRSQIVNDLSLGRSIPEILRLVDALQFTEEHGEVCPANWKKGDTAIQASPSGIAKYLTENAGNL